jgi:SAM-dependent methyltransferase
MQGYGDSTYGDAFADVYDDWYADLGDVDAAVEVLSALHESVRGHPIVELGVGTGRLAVPLARRTGATVVGLDASEAMLQRLAANDPDGLVTPLRAGMISVPPGPLSVVFVAYNTLFGLRSADDQQRCIAAVGHSLAPGGFFVVEAFVPDTPDPQSVTVRELRADRVVLSVSTTDATAQTANGHFVEITEAAGVRLRPWSIRWSTPEQIDTMAAAAGLALHRRSASWAGDPFDDSSNRHVSVYRRPL